MKRKWRSYCRALILPALAAMLFSGCTTASNSTEEDSIEPWEEPDLSGVWLGYFNEVFAVGIIVPGTDDYYAWFVADDRNYISPADSPLVVTPGSAIFTGDLDEYSWSGLSPSYTASRESLYVLSSAATKLTMGVNWPSGAYTYTTKHGAGLFVFFYNTTYEVSPNVRNVGGTWEIEGGGHDGGTTINLVITPSIDNTTGGTIRGADNRGNSFAGSIAIRYTPEPRNVYTVSMRMNDTIDMTGLATYILEMQTSGISIGKKTLAIGAVSDDHAYSLSGLARKK